MIRNHLSKLMVVGWILSGCASTEVPQAPSAGLITGEPGGTVGYQHGIERSQFIVGANRKAVSEFGFVKVVGSEGAFAVDAANGAVIAIPHATSTEQQKAVWYTLGADKHNQQVLNYFVVAGIPHNQIAGVYANTYLYASGGENDLVAAQPKIAGWQSVLQRVVAGVPVPDSLAWARINEQGRVISEWVYWPSISAQAIEDSKQLRAILSHDSGRQAFLSRLPGNLPPGNVAIRHSSATADGPFEVFASYDVVERSTSADAPNQFGSSNMRLLSTKIRHFDVEGNEHKLPQERPSQNGDFPTKKRPPPEAAGAH